MSLAAGIARFAGKAGLTLAKNSPLLMVGGGAVCLVGATAYAIKSSLSYYEKVSEPHLTHIYDLEAGKAEKKVLDKAKWHFLLATARHYAPAIVLTGAGIALIACGQIQHARRFAAISSAYTALCASKTDELLALTDGDDLTQETLERVDVASRTGFRDNLPDEDYRNWTFSESNPNYTSSQIVNQNFLTSTENYMNDRLQRKGVVFLNEVYDALGMPRTKLGAVMGWSTIDGRDDFIDLEWDRRIEPDDVVWYELHPNVARNLLAD